jgi:hypothetical protein
VLILQVVTAPPFLAPSIEDDGIVGVPIPRYPGASLTVAGVPPRVAIFRSDGGTRPVSSARIGPGRDGITGGFTGRSDGGTRPVSSARIGPGRGVTGGRTGGRTGGVTGGRTGGRGTGGFF